MTSREEQRREHNEQKELESLRRVFDSLDRTKCGKVGFKELNDQLVKLDYRAKRVEVEDMIWEVDEDCDHAVSWDEFKLMFHRCRNDRTGLEPRKLFNVVEFMMHDKDSSGTIDMDECMEILFRRFGKEQLEEKTNEFFKHDTDGDNAISFAEFQKQMQAIRPKRREANKPTGNRSSVSNTSATSLSSVKGSRPGGRR